LAQWVGECGAQLQPLVRGWRPLKGHAVSEGKVPSLNLRILAGYRIPRTSAAPDGEWRPMV
jgi:hypothetical protein